MSTAPKPRPKPEPNHAPAVVESGTIYTVDELARRLRWRKHSLRQARKMGLPTVRFGSRDYALGDHVLAWFADLAEKQNKT